MAPRVGPDPAPGEDAADLLAKLAPAGRVPLNIFRTLAHHPRLLRRYVQLGGVFLREGQLPPRERELVILRVAWLTRSVYEFGQHTLIGGAAGLTDEEVGRLAAAGTSGWKPDDRLLLEAAGELCSGDVIEDATWAALAQRWSVPQLLELVMLIGFYRMTAGFLRSAGVDLEPGVPDWPEGTR